MKYYFGSQDDELCYTKEYFIEQMFNSGLTEMVVFEAVKDEMPSGVFWCREDSEFYDKGNCSRFCKKYEPKNNKSGCCRHYSLTNYMHGEPILIKL